MAVVYRARQVTLDRIVALKIMCASTRNPDDLRRFKREALTTSRIEHENVIRIYDWGLWRGSPFISMELIEGSDLQNLIRKNFEFTRLNSTSIIKQILNGLRQFHDSEIVHRDIKPGNVMITTAGRAILMDFGLGKEVSANVTALTHPGCLIGTPSYLPPEALANLPVSPAADIWAVGCLWYALLTGRPPFGGRDIAETIQMIVQDPIPPLSLEARGISPSLLPVLMRCLEKNPDNRFPDAAHALSAILDGEKPTHGKPRGSHPGGVNHECHRPHDDGGGPAVQLKEQHNHVRAGHPLNLLGLLFVIGLIAWVFTHPRWSREEKEDHALSEIQTGSEDRRTAALVSPTDEPWIALRRALFRLRPSARLMEIHNRTRAILDNPPVSQSELNRLFAGVKTGLLKALEALEVFQEVARVSRSRIRPVLSANESAALYRNIADLWIILGLLEKAGYPIELDLSAAFPPDHRPLVQTPPGPGTSYALEFSPSMKKSRREGIQYEVISTRISNSIMLWIPGAGGPSSTEIAALVPTSEPTQLVTSEEIVLRPVDRGEILVLNVCVVDLGASEVLRFRFGPPGTRGTDALSIRGTRTGENTCSEYYHTIRPDLAKDPVQLTITFQDFLESIGSDCKIKGISFEYLKQE